MHCLLLSIALWSVEGAAFAQQSFRIADWEGKADFNASTKQFSYCYAATKRYLDDELTIVIHRNGALGLIVANDN